VASYFREKDLELGSSSLEKYTRGETKVTDVSNLEIEQQFHSFGET
jgi:hypothetical protein